MGTQQSSDRGSCEFNVGILRTLIDKTNLLVIAAQWMPGVRGGIGPSGSAYNNNKEYSQVQIQNNFLSIFARPNTDSGHNYPT